MNHMWSNALEVLNKKAPVAERQASFRELFQSDFDSGSPALFSAAIAAPAPRNRKN